MKKAYNIIVRLLAVILLLVLGMGFVSSGMYKDTFRDYGYKLVAFNGNMSKIIHMQGYNSEIGLYATDDYYYVSITGKTSTDYEVEQTLAFRDFLEENNINLIYVNEPTKYVDDLQFRETLGVESYSNRNADLFLSRIRDAGVNTIDLRDNLSADGIDVTDMFYKTDHHWTTSAGLWASRIMADGLNRYCGYDIDLSIYDEDKYEYKTWTSCWLGEQGKKTGAYSSLDDYTEIKPAFDTDYTFINDDHTAYDGDFSNFINENFYVTGGNIYTDASWHYSYQLINCINNNVESGKILLLADSYDHVTECFLSLGVHEVDVIILRETEHSFNLRENIIQNEYDTVIIAYAQHMIGAYKDSNSNNRRMFLFNK